MSNPIARFILILPIVFIVLIKTLAGQVPTQEQLKSADAQLNKVYQQLRGSLNAEQKQQLKAAQRDWIKKRDSFVAANPSNPEGALYQATIGRIKELEAYFGRVNSSKVLARNIGSIATNGTDSALIQVPTQEQLQAADAQLNQVYQRLRGTLNEVQKQILKAAQRDWIKKRDVYVAANPGNPQGALYQVTMRRVNELNGFLGGSKNEDLTAKFTNQIENGSLKTSENIRTNSLDDLTEILKTNEVPYDRIEALKKYDALLRRPDDSQPSTEEIINTVNRLNGSPEIINVKGLSELQEAIPLRGTENFRVKLLDDISVKWPRETDYQWLTEWNKAVPIIQHKIEAELASEAISEKLIARTYKNNPSIYIYDSKTKIEIFSINLNNIYRWFRDMWNVPRNLCFSEDGKFLIARRYGSGGGYLCGNIYIINTSSWEVGGVQGYPFSGEYLPLIIKKNTGEITLLQHPFYSDYAKEKYQLLQVPDGSSLYSNVTNKLVGQKCLDALREKYNKEDNNYDGEISSRIINGECFIEMVRPGIIAFKWESLFGTNSYKINLNELKSDKFSGLLEPSTREEKLSSSIISNIPIPCFWGFLSDVKHDCSDEKCRKDTVVTNVFVSSDSKWILPKYRYDLGKQPSGWQEASSLGVYDVKKANWVGLPFLRRMWSTVPIWDGANWVSHKIAETTTNSKGIVSFKYQKEDAKHFPHRLSGSVDELAKYLPICLPARNGPPNDFARHHYYNATDQNLWISSEYDGLFRIDLNSGKLEKIYRGIPSFQALCVDGCYLYGIPNVDNPQMEVWDINKSQKIVDVFISSSGNSLFVTPENYFSSDFKTSRIVAFRSGNNGFPLEQFDLRLNRPDIVLDKLAAPAEAIEAAKYLRDKRLKRMGVTEEMLKPDFHLPEVALISEIPSTTSSDQIDLKIKATDDKYPLERLRVYVNNVPINGTEGESLRDQKTQSLERTIPVKLASGRNKIQVSVLNSAGAESLYANAEVNCTAERPKLKLYAVALGVSQYDRPEWCLKYAAKDATDLIGKLKAKAGSSYSEVRPLLLTDKEVTKESVAKIKEFLSGATIDDTVLIFMAGHGLLDDKYDYYFGTTDIDPARPSDRGMPYEAIENILAEVPSLKKALLMDTCHAGELDDDEKKELAASDGSSAPATTPDNSTNSPLAGKVAMRAIGTRGMQVKAIEGAKGKSDWYERLQDMFVDLRRGSGATVISSSQGAEYAFESSEQSNGLFTYALMEALDGKATRNKDGQITISTVGDYVKKRVQDLTKGKQNPNLRGVNLEEDFTLSSSQ